MRRQGKVEYSQYHRPMRYGVLLLTLLLCFLSGCGLLPAQTTNKRDATPQTRHQLTYVAIGASDTFGFGSSDPYNQNWATDLAGKLGPRYHLINLGIPSMHLHDALTSELPVALDAHPDLVTIWLAVNDLADNVPVQSYARDLDMLLQRLQANNPQVHIAIANVPDLTLLPHFAKQAAADPQALQQSILAYNTVIAAAARQHHTILIDLSQERYDLQHHPEYISDDGLHPTRLGYEQLALIFYEALQTAKYIN
ncbi:SGNH/GDSL hydrolase family protein [Reticulibacter mediterranei]|uniref:SGNH/GDSL hydrolase family protein n=1 Tax=Reticulibacter mediterranei TaxID=2778369 RepID=UPI001C68B38F|nr:GDSL-type esterase/lipase family protein [Reticulibacter mediterranei]